MMKLPRIRKAVSASAAVLLTVCTLSGCSRTTGSKKIPVSVLILPKFEVGEMTGDFPGEAQLFYEEYLAGGDVYEIEGIPDPVTLYCRDGIALCLTGQGKVAAALNTSAVLSDPRFDFSDAYILSVGCGGSAEGYGIFGDVFIITSAVDFELGHRADPREMSGDAETTWFHDESFDGTAVIRMNPELTDRAFGLVEDVQLQTTEQTMKFLEKEFAGEPWAQRLPKVMRGTSVTGDNFWKGRYGHLNALLITETYSCTDPYSITEMEDIAVSHAVKQAGLLDRLIVLRVSVNMDTFPSGITPEILWGPETDDHIASGDSVESVDIFSTAMQNCFDTAEVLIEAIRKGRLQ